MSIRYEVTGRVATVTLDRPDQRNAVTPEMNAELFDAFRRAESDDDVRAILLTGAGKAFCAGADVKWFIEHRVDRTTAVDPRDPAQRADYDDPADLRFLLEMRTPIVAAINGPAIGYGLTMTLQCDVRIAGASARFSMMFIRRAMVPDFGSLYVLPRIVGQGHAHEMCLTGKEIDADEAARIGLVNRVVPDADLLGEAGAVAESIAAQAPLPIGFTRQGLHRSWRSTLDDTLEFQRLTMDACRLGPDYTARLEAFRGKD